MRSRRGHLVAIALIAAAAIAAPPPARAGAPNLMIDIGKTTAIASTINGGGVSLGVGTLWPVEEAPWSLPIRFGVMGYWDDMGTVVGPLVNPSGVYLGLAADRHESAFGGAFRLDWAPRLTHRRFEPYASSTWGYYRIEDDLRGRALSGVSAPGFSLGAGLAYPLASGHRLGLVVRYHRLFDDVAGRYVSGALEWGWRSGS